MPDEVWSWLCRDQALVRRDVVAVVQERVAAGQWPDSLDVADAILRRSGIAA